MSQLGLEVDRIEENEIQDSRFLMNAYRVAVKNVRSHSVVRIFPPKTV